MLYEEQYTTAPILCLHCATFFVPSKTGLERCPNCSRRMDETTYEEWFRHAFYAVRYGYQYRQAHETLAPGDTASRPFLPPLDEVYTYMGIVAIGQLNGCATQDLSRRAMIRILDLWNSISDAIERVDFNVDDIDIFMRGIEDYFQDLRGVQAELERDPAQSEFAANVTRIADARGLREAARAPPGGTHQHRLPAKANLWTQLPE